MKFLTPLKTENIYIGAMSGTSVDKHVDFTAACFSANGELLGHDNLTVELPECSRGILYKLSTTSCDQLSVNQRREGEAVITDFLIDAFLSVIQRWGLENHPKEKIILSPHGQTIDHQPELKSTDQLLHGERLAYETGYSVVFRHRQACIPFSHAAPLAPVLLENLFKQGLLCAAHKDLVVINGGGVANICILGENRPVVAFDSGPANGPLDELIRHIIRVNKKALPTDLAPGIIKNGFDVSGAWAKRGAICKAMKEKLLAHPYFSNPQSADRCQFGLDWVLGAKGDASWQDTVTTLSHVIASTIADSISKHVSGRSPKLGFYGGLRYNHCIINNVLSQLNASSIEQIDWEAINLNPDFMESLLMAYLGFCVHQNRPVCLDYCAFNQANNSPLRPAAWAIPGIHISQEQQDRCA